VTLTATQYDIVRATWVPTGGATGTQAVITAPDATTTTVTGSSASALPDVWTIWFSVEQTGTYQVAWSLLDANGNVIDGGNQYTDQVVVSAFTQEQILTLDDCYNSLNLPLANQGQDAARDADMLFYAEAATKVVEGIIGPVMRQFKSQIFDGGSGSVKLSWPPTTILSIIENGVQIYDWVPDMFAGIIHAGTTWWNRPFWPGIQNVEVRYMAGSGNVPPNVMLAAREEFRFLWQIGRQGMRPSASQEADFASAVPQGFGIPNRVYELLSRTDQLPGFA
jgi:hypothetical protein